MSTPFTPLHRGGSGSPMVCLHGFSDTWRPPLSDAEWVTLDGVGHCPQLDSPETTAELVLALTGRAGG